MKILLISGHGAGDSGATGCGFQEANKTREFTSLLKNSFSNYSCTVDIYDTNRNAYYDCQNGTFNIGQYDYVLEIHFNAFNSNAHGTECFVTYSEAGITVEQAMMGQMAKYFTLRDNDNIFDGVKRENFLVINTVKSRGISGSLLEICFIDNAANMHIYENEKTNIANDIVYAICTEFGVSAKISSSPTPAPAVPETNALPYKVGDVVTLSTYYSNSNATPDQAIYPSTWKTGTITKVLSNGALNPYLLDNGFCWFNDGDVRGTGTVSVPSEVLNGIPSDFNYQKGVFTLTAKSQLAILDAPSVNGRPSGSYYYLGESVIYDGYVNRDGFIWISWVSETTKTRRWMAVREMPSMNPYGTFV